MSGRLVAAFLLVGAILPSTGCDRIVKCRFHVTSSTGEVLRDALIRREEAREMDLASYTDADGCLGVSWIVAAYPRILPLSLEKAEFRPAYVEVPILDDLCYEVTLSRIDEDFESRVEPVPLEACGCEMFSGRMVWRDR